jgi:hypothetical protein
MSISSDCTTMYVAGPPSSVHDDAEVLRHHVRTAPVCATRAGLGPTLTPLPSLLILVIAVGRRATSHRVLASVEWATTPLTRHHLAAPESVVQAADPAPPLLVVTWPGAGRRRKPRGCDLLAPIPPGRSMVPRVGPLTGLQQSEFVVVVQRSYRRAGDFGQRPHAPSRLVYALVSDHDSESGTSPNVIKYPHASPSARPPR